jgi:hypothetical protein
MKQKSLFLAFIAIFLGIMTFKQFDFETFKFKSAVAFVYLITSLAAGYFYFNPLKTKE